MATAPSPTPPTMSTVFIVDPDFGGCIIGGKDTGSRCNASCG